MKTKTRCFRNDKGVEIVVDPWSPIYSLYDRSCAWTSVIDCEKCGALEIMMHHLCVECDSGEWIDVTGLSDEEIAVVRRQM